MKASVTKALLRWETLLALVLFAVMAVNTLLSPYFLDAATLSDASFNFTEKALIALPMALLIITREIDVSVAATVALASVAMGFAAAAGLPTSMLVLVGWWQYCACHRSSPPSAR
jgi:rhamnose transport system permease protein